MLKSSKRHQEGSDDTASRVGFLPTKNHTSVLCWHVFVPRGPPRGGCQPGSAHRALPLLYHFLWGVDFFFTTKPCGWPQRALPQLASLSEGPSRQRRRPSITQHLLSQSISPTIVSGVMIAPNSLSSAPVRRSIFCNEKMYVERRRGASRSGHSLVARLYPSYTGKRGTDRALSGIG